MKPSTVCCTWKSCKSHPAWLCLDIRKGSVQTGVQGMERREICEEVKLNQTGGVSPQAVNQHGIGSMTDIM
jgi:hypothetical protein